MTRRKADVVATTAQSVGMTSAAAGRVIDAFLSEVAKSLVAGESVSLGAFGSFAVEPPPSPPAGVHANRIGLKVSMQPKFKAGKALR